MSEKLTTLKQFQRRFPNDDVCLDHLMRVRYGVRHNCQSCHRSAKFYRVANRRCFECEHCGYQVYPTAGTPFEQTRTPLMDWFFVMFLFSASRNGVAAKEVQRQLGVTYKTAWRMCHKVREHMGAVDGDRPLGGAGQAVVEIDETFLGGRDRMGHDDKASILGMVERNGDVVTRQIADCRGTLLRHARRAKAGGVTQTEQPPANPGRFRSSRSQHYAACRPMGCQRLTRRYG
jgi:transposase